MEIDRLLTADEVAEICRIPKGTLSMWRSQGTGPNFARLGRRVVYRESEIHAWVEAQFAAAASGDR